MQVIPVDRPQDHKIPGVGSILHIKNELIIGSETKFTMLKIGDTLKIKQFSDDFVVKQVINDTEVIVSYPKPFEKLSVQSSYLIIPKLDQSQLYSSAWNALHQGVCLGIFPEGGSHDRTEMLPLKAGVCIMGLGAMNAYHIPVKIVPCGLNYYRGHEFRSKALVEFGQSYDIPPDLAHEYQIHKKEAITKLLSNIEKMMRGVTIRAPSYSDLVAVYTAKSLYVPDGYQLTPKEEFILNRRMTEGYNKFKDHPDIEQLMKAIKEYRSQLKTLALSDGQLRTIASKRSAFFPKFLKSLVFFAISLVFGLPGFFLNGPIGIVASYVAEKERIKALKKSLVKVKATDVMASQKLVTSFVAFPVASFVWTFAFYCLLTRIFRVPHNTGLTYSMIFFVIWPFYSYTMILCYDVLIKNFRRVVAWMYLLLYKDRLEDLLRIRNVLREKITEFVDQHGAEVVEDFDNNRIINKQSRQRKMQIELDKAFEILKELYI